MKQRIERSRVRDIFLASRPKFLVASAAPVLVGSCLGYAVTGSFNPGLFVLASLAIMALHAGANIVNDFYDHLSQNDWVNENPTPFSGGRRFIQNGILSPKATLLEGLIALIIGSIIGLVIVVITQSLFILILGLVGLAGGFFYTARPIQLGYRSVGELAIFLLFGLLPVYASYYLQAKTIDLNPLLPGSLVGILIFLVILINEFPDREADARVSKRTLVVRLGVPASAWIYRAALAASFIVAVTMLVRRPTFVPGVLYFLTLPVALVTLKSVTKKDLLKPGQLRASRLTVLLHNAGSLALAVGFVITGLRVSAT